MLLFAVALAFSQAVRAADELLKGSFLRPRRGELCLVIYARAFLRHYA